MKTISPIVIFATLGWLWFASGYLLYNYVWANALSYFIFPFVVFGILPYFIVSPEEE